jgi:hypothetical protein
MKWNKNEIVKKKNGRQFELQSVPLHHMPQYKKDLITKHLDQKTKKLDQNWATPMPKLELSNSLCSY